MAKITPEDRKLFRDAVKNLKFSPANHKKSAKTSISPIDLYDPTYQTVLPTDTLFYSRGSGGLQNKVIHNLKTGKINIQAELDLHGYTAETAREAVRNFMYNSQTRQLKYIRIIHGKGNILKNHVNSWLKQFDFVLAFASAAPKHGGTGAVCIILKRTG